MAPSMKGNSNKKKRKRSQPNDHRLQDVSLYANLTGTSTTTGIVSSSFDDCMMEMSLMMETGPRDHPKQINKDKSRSVDNTSSVGFDESENNTHEKKETNPSRTMDGQPSSNSSSTTLVLPPSWTRNPPFMTDQNIQSWEQNFVKWADTNTKQYTPGLLPNIDEELARNFKVKELSTELLKHSKGTLRMPIFERWLIDSKFEEEYHNTHHTSKNMDDSNDDDDEMSMDDTRSNSFHHRSCGGTTTDPVLPSKATPLSAASKRLVKELTSTSTTSSTSKFDSIGSNQSDRCLSVEQARNIVAELCRNCNVASQEMTSQRERYQKQSSLRKGDRIEVETTAKSTPSSSESSSSKTVTILYTRKKWKKPFCFRINSDSLEQLRRRFFHIHRGLSTKTQKHRDLTERSFLVLVVSLLLRYSALSGGQLLDDLRGGGMQGAIHSKVFDVLQKHLSPSTSPSPSFVSNSQNKSQSSVSPDQCCWLEGFASPFNATLDRFGSAFPDLDWHFGSIGSFWSCPFGAPSTRSVIRQQQQDTIVEEYCEANPPFSPGLMEGMVHHMMERLKIAEQNRTRLTFVVIVPTVKKASKGSSSSKRTRDDPHMEAHSTIVQDAASSSFRSMVDSVYCVNHIPLHAREHGYVEGAQHLRPTKYKQSTYDTSVIILQSPEAATKHRRNADTLEKDIRAAFASQHQLELERRKG